MVNRQQKYTEADILSDIIHEDQSLLWVISRFGLSLGFGNSTVKNVCDSNSIDCYTFLAVINFLSEEDFDIENNYNLISIPALIPYLKSAHSYFLEFKLPSIRKKLLDAVQDTEQTVPYSKLFMQFFDEYVEEVKKHMEYENRVVFEYVTKLIGGNTSDKYSIAVFQKRHNEIDSKLSELKNILIKYYPAKGTNYLLTDVLFDILMCEKDLASHNQVEDYMFVPAVEKLELKLKAAK